MTGGTERLLEARSAVPADSQKSIGEAEALFLTNASQPLAKGDRDRGCHALASQLCQFLCHPVGLVILDLQSHFLPFRREVLTSLRLGNVPPSKRLAILASF
jgi:hypothetical protein